MAEDFPELSQMAREVTTLSGLARDYTKFINSGNLETDHLKRYELTTFQNLCMLEANLKLVDPANHKYCLIAAVAAQWALAQAQDVATLLDDWKESGDTAYKSFHKTNWEQLSKPMLIALLVLHAEKPGIKNMPRLTDKLSFRTMRISMAANALHALRAAELA